MSTEMTLVETAALNAAFGTTLPLPPEVEAKPPSLSEVVALCAVDSALFASTFFPKTARQQSPPFHRDIWRLLESANRFVNIQVFRGGAKTSILRMYTAKRIAYGLAHTILYIGRSEGHAVRSVKWIRQQIEYNRQFAGAFNLRKGSKWQDTEAEIWQGTDQYPVWILGLGITGSVRGVNLDDYRPDLIVIDDVIDDENSATPEQRDKINDLIHGALKESLAPASEAPDAKMVMLQTPLSRADASMKALDDNEWVSAVHSCWTPSTANLSPDEQLSIWPERWSHEELRNAKALAAQSNRLSIFLREKECRLISPETSAFRGEWLNFYDLAPERNDMHVIMALDPVPPPSDVQIAKSMRGKDYEAFAVVGRCKGEFYLLDYITNRGHEPNWTIAEFFRLALKWRPRKVMVETTAYQRTLAWLLRQAMQHQGRYYVVQEWTDRRKKFDRIVDGLAGPASNGQLYVMREHEEFTQQFIEYPSCPHDDLLESVAIAVAELNGFGMGASDEDILDELMHEEEDLPALVYERGAP